jgi:hypothetical protein
MPIFKIGSFSQVGLSFAQSSRVVKVEHKKEVKFPKRLSLHALSEVSFNIEPPKMDLAKSPAKWGLYLKRLSLYESFEGFIANLFNHDNEIYFTSVAWDYSGSRPFVYPPKGTKCSDFLIPMKSNTKREFVGDGVNIWPAQTVVGALNLVIIVYESDQDERDLGDQLVDIHVQVAKSKLAALVQAISENPSLATGVAIGTAVNELLGVVGNIMKRNGDDYVDLFEGSYGTDKQQTARVEKYDHEAAGVELDFTVS